VRGLPELRPQLEPAAQRPVSQVLLLERARLVLPRLQHAQEAPQ
jgi:hypothetical protein